MPIQLNYTNPATAENISASYWVINRANFDYINNLVEIHIYGWVNLAAFTAHKDPAVIISNRTLTFTQAGVTGSSTNAQMATAVYSYLLTNDAFFAGGSIV